MNVGELIAELQKFSPETPVIVAQDEEGNGFNPLSDIAFSRVRLEDYDYHVLHPDDEDEYEDVIDEFKWTVVIWP